MPLIYHREMPFTAYSARNFQNGKSTIKESGWLYVDCYPLGSSHLTINGVGQASNFGSPGNWQNNNTFLTHVNAGDEIDVSMSSVQFFPDIVFDISYIIKADF